MWLRLSRVPRARVAYSTRCYAPDALSDDNASLYAVARDFAVKEMLPHAEVRACGGSVSSRVLNRPAIGVGRQGDFSPCHAGTPGRAGLWGHLRTRGARGLRTVACGGRHHF